MISTSRKEKTGKYNCTKSYLDAYELYKSKFNFTSGAGDSKFGKSNPSSLMITKKQFKDIWFDIADDVFKEILEDSKSLKLPFGLGEQFRIQKKKMPIGLLQKKKTLKFDYGSYIKTGSKKFYLNEHTDYYRYKFYWFCKKGPKNRKLYKLVPLRIRKRELANQIINKEKDYFL